MRGRLVEIRIPKVTIHADYGEDVSAGDIGYVSLGYGCHQAWIYACMFGASIFPNTGVRIDVPGSQGSLTLMFVVSIVAFSIFLLTLGLNDKTFLSKVVTRGFVKLGAAFMALGTFLWCFLGAVGISNAPIDVIAGILTGIGSGALTISWGIAYARRDELSILLNTSIMIVIAMFIYSFLLHHVPRCLAIAIVSLIPIFEMYLLLKNLPRPYYERGELPIFKTLSVQRPRFFLMFGLPVFLFGLAVGVLRQTAIQSVVPSVTIEMQFTTLLAAGSAALITAFVAIVSGDGCGERSNHFRVVVPVIVVGIFFLPSALAGVDQFSAFMLLVGYMCFEMLLWAYFGTTSQRFNLSPVFVFGVGRGLAAIASLIGSAIPIFSGYMEAQYDFDSTMTVMAVLVVVMFAYCLMPNEREIAKTVLKCPLLTAVHSGQFVDDVSFSSVEFAEKQEQSLENAKREASESQEKQQPRRRWFKENCEAVASRYLLSQRETEVLFLLAKGYNSSSIQEKLYISEGTAKTHIRHIYRKLDVHSQQEVMHIIEKGE